MAQWVRFPKMGTNITEGTVGAWRKAAGEAVRRGDILTEIITSKATFEIESPADGMLGGILAPEKSHVPVGYVLALVGEAVESAAAAEAENARLMAAFRAEMSQQLSGGAASAVSVRATPGARRLAKEAGLRLEKIPMPAGAGVLREEDVRRFLDGSGGR